MIPALTVAAALCALLAIAADWEEKRHRAFYALKPLTTILILAIALLAPAPSPEYQRFIAAALVLSLLGDICLMFKGDGWFLGGLGSFFLAHFAFAAAFLRGVGTPDPPGWLAIVLVYAGVMLFVLLPRAGKLKVPVLIYCAVLAGMAFTASVRYTALHDARSFYAMLGALIFVVSDSALGFRQFVGKHRGAQALILSTYWTAIGLIAWSV